MKWEMDCDPEIPCYKDSLCPAHYHMYFMSAPLENRPKWDAKKPHVPVDKDANWLHYPTYQHSGYSYVEEFHARLVVTGMVSGRSAKYFTLAHERTGQKYTMFMSDMVDFIKRGNLEEGVLFGLWTATKRGGNYGIKLVE